MANATKLLVAIGALLGIVVLTGAGDLDPPAGPVAPTMKTLDEVEPRTPLDPADVPIAINRSGSYYLTGDISAVVLGQDAITINADDVTLDLMGFCIKNSEVAFFDDGIVIASTAENVSILNGSIIGSGNNGVSGLNASGARLTDLRVLSSGVRGIIVGDNATIRRCAAIGNGSTGLFCNDNSVMVDCIARDNQASGLRTGMGSTIHGCAVIGNGSTGLFCNDNSVMVDCIARDNQSSGLRTGIGSTIRGCVATGNTSTGILGGGNSVVVQSVANNNGTLGISTGIAGNVTQCSVRANGSNGISVGSGSLVDRCVSRSNGGDGISAFNSTRILGCYAADNAEHGIDVSSDCMVTGNSCDENGTAIADGAGIHCSSSDNRVDQNSCTDNDRGFWLESGGNILVRNTASGNGTNYAAVGGNDVGTEQTTPVGAGAWDNFSF